MYVQVSDPFTGAPSVTVVLRTTDNTFIPVDPRNADYQAYQIWLAAGNLPTPPATS